MAELRTIPSANKGGIPTLRHHQVHVAGGDWDGKPTACPTASSGNFKPPSGFWTSTRTHSGVSEWAEKCLTTDPDLLPFDPTAFLFKVNGNPRILVLDSNHDIAAAWADMQPLWKRAFGTVPDFNVAKFWDLAQEHYDAVRVPSSSPQSKALRSWDTESTVWFHPERDLDLCSKHGLTRVVAPVDLGYINQSDPDDVACDGFRKAWEAARERGPVFARGPVIPDAEAGGNMVETWYVWDDKGNPDKARMVARSDINLMLARLDVNGAEYALYSQPDDGSASLVRKVKGRVVGDTPEAPATVTRPTSGPLKVIMIGTDGKRTGLSVDQGAETAQLAAR